VKVDDSIVKFLDKGDSGAGLRRSESARWVMGMFQGIVPQSVVCSHGVSQLSFSIDICVLVLKPFYAGESPIATPCVRVTEFKLCMALLAWESVPFLPRCIGNVALPAGLSNPESQFGRPSVHNIRAGKSQRKRVRKRNEQRDGTGGDMASHIK